MRVNIWKVSTVVLAVALAAVVSSSGVKSAQAENQPHMQAAMTALKAAKEQLQKATADKGGHRVKAIELTNAAIAETQKGIDYDDKH